MARPTKSELEEAFLELWFHTLGLTDVPTIPPDSRKVIDDVARRLHRKFGLREPKDQTGA